MDMIGHTVSPRALRLRSIAGLLLVMAGVMLFVDRYLRTGWLSYAILPAAGFILFYFGVRYRNTWTVLAGGIIGGVGLGLGTAFSPLFNHNSIAAQIGTTSLYSGAGWFIAVWTTVILKQRRIWWGLIPAGILLGLGYCLAFTPMRWFDFVLFLSLGISLALFTWGIAQKYIGLVIAGCLLASVGPAIYLGWGTPDRINPLVSTGIMLVWLAFGWLMITVSGRIVIRRFIWWPLIPGGILAMVGFGLYIGGDPDNAIGFISNTGSVGLIIFGLYLLLMRKGIHR